MQIDAWLKAASDDAVRDADRGIRAASQSPAPDAESRVKPDGMDGE